MGIVVESLGVGILVFLAVCVAWWLGYQAGRRP